MLFERLLSRCRQRGAIMFIGMALAWLPLGAAADTVAAVKAVADGNSVSNVSGTVVQVGGNSGRLQFALQDATGGIIVDRGSLTSYTLPSVGDTVTISAGTKTTFQGVIQLQPTSAGAVSITGTATLPAPLAVTSVRAVQGADPTFLQGRLIRVRGVRLVDPQPAGAGTTTWLGPSITGNVEYVVADDSGATMTLRFPNDLAGAAATYQAKERPTTSPATALERNSAEAAGAERFDIVTVPVPASSTVMALRLAANPGTTAKTDSVGPIRPATSRTYAPTSGDFARADSRQVRIAAYNTEKFLLDPSAAPDSAFRRLLPTIDPDIIGFEEVVPTFTATQIRNRLNELMPTGTPGGWNVVLGKSDGFNRCVLASRWPISMGADDTTPTTGLRGATVGLVDLPDSIYGPNRDFYLMVLHFKCCGGNIVERQQQADAVAKWFGDLRQPGGDITLPTTGTPIMAMGDFNLVDPDPQGPDVTLRTGDISDNATYGVDTKGDWDVSDITDMVPVDAIDGDIHTWPSGSGNPTSRLDRFYYTDSVATVANSFVLNTRGLTSTQLAAAGLRLTDNENACDHLPIVADFAVPVVPVSVSVFSVE